MCTHFSPHLICVTTLPCETQMFQIVIQRCKNPENCGQQRMLTPSIQDNKNWIFSGIWNQKLDKKRFGLFVGENWPHWIHWAYGWQWSSPHCACCRERRRCRRNGSQEDQPRTHRTVRQISRESGIHRSSVNRIMKTDLKLKCLKKTNAQALTAANKQSRMTRARQLLEKYPATMVNFMFFTDEKDFTVAAPTIL